MAIDAFVKELHRIREENARKHKFDAQAMARDFMKRQHNRGHHVVDLRRNVKPTPVGTGR